MKPEALLDLRAHIPNFVAITHGNAADLTLLDALMIEREAFYVLDAASPTSCLYGLTQAPASFAIRGKRGLDYVRRVSRPMDRSIRLRSEQTIVLSGPKTATPYPV